MPAEYSQAVSIATGLPGRPNAINALLGHYLKAGATKPFEI